MYSVKAVLTATAAMLLALTTPAAAGPAAATTPARPSVSSAPRPCDGAATCYVDVAVAQVWVSPEQVRPVDAPATTNPADIRGWLTTMSLDERREVAGETQALHGITVTVDRTEWHGGLLWDHVWVHGQPTPGTRRDGAPTPAGLPTGN